MTTPDGRKTMQVSPDVHAAVHELATQLGTSADGALRHLLNPCTIRVQASARQHERWSTSARADGLTLEEWISHRIEEGALQDADRRTLNQIFYRVDALCRQAGVQPQPRRTLNRREQS